VQGMVSIFNYGFPVAAEAVRNSGLKYYSLTAYPELIDLAVEKGIVTPGRHEILLKWRDDPAKWEGVQ